MKFPAPARSSLGGFLCWTLSCVMLLSQPMWVLGQQPSATRDTTTTGDQQPVADLDLSYCTPGACVALVVHPRRLLTAPEMTMLPIEVATAAGLEHLGIDPLDVEQLQAFVEPPFFGPPAFAVVVKFNKPFDMLQLKPAVRGHATPAELGDKQYLQSPTPVLPSFFMPDSKTLIAATDGLLRRVQGKAGADEPGSLARHMQNAAAGADAYLAVNLEVLRPMINAGLDQARTAGDIPPPMLPLLDAPAMIAAVDLTLNIVSAGTSQLVVHANNDADATKLEKLVDDAFDVYRQEVDKAAEEMLQSDDPIERAFGQYIQRVQTMPSWKRSGPSVTETVSTSVQDESRRRAATALQRGGDRRPGGPVAAGRPGRP